MEIQIRKGTSHDIDDLEKLYNALNDSLEKGVNYPGWKKGVYPIRDDAEQGIENGTLFVAVLKDNIVGTIILNHEPEEAYKEIQWEFEFDYSDVFVVHTFLVHPEYKQRGVGKQLMDFAEQYAKDANIKSIRLDVYEGNLPAIQLYKKCGFQYKGNVDLGLEAIGLKWFQLYEKMVD